ncbi:MAG: hypothetical protein R3D67_07250 [Hyphomicrobiaceae bacterium]
MWFGSYGAMKDAVLANQLDAFGSVPTSANMRQIRSSPRGLVGAVRSSQRKRRKAITDVVSFAGP